MYTLDDFSIPTEERNDADAWLHEAYYWDMEGEYDKAVFCMTKAVELGSVLACNYLADYYADGQGVAQDYVRAAELYARVATYREPIGVEGYRLQSMAAYILGTFHEEGLLPDASPTLAAEWYHKAMNDAKDIRFPTPAFALAYLYLDGRGVEQNATKAFELVRDAIPHLFDGADEPQVRTLCLRLLECEDIAANEEYREFLQDQADRLCKTVCPF